VRRLIHEHGFDAFQPNTSDGRADAPSHNFLLNAPLPNKVWAGDITFIPYGDKRLYLTIVSDLCARRIVGWALAEQMRSDLVTEALQQALNSRRGNQSLIFHSDHGSQ